MKKHIAIHLLGGTQAEAARAIGCAKQSVQEWRTDKYGNILSRRVSDRVLATLVRMNHHHRKANPEGERPGLDDATLDDLMFMPESCEE